MAFYDKFGTKWYNEKMQKTLKLQNYEIVSKKYQFSARKHFVENNCYRIRIIQICKAKKLVACSFYCAIGKFCFEKQNVE